MPHTPPLPFEVGQEDIDWLIYRTFGLVEEATVEQASEADPEQGKLSILSELGVALIGFSVGDTIEWEFPEGPRCIRINMIYFQPEATKQYDL